MAKHIRVKTVSGASDGNDLLNYYFEENGDGYDFYAPTTPTPTKLNTSLITPQNASFSFVNPGPAPQPTFTITVTSFPAVLAMTGSWSDGGAVRDDDVAGSGSFQAQAGGTGPMEEEAAAASA